jgi:lysophospholipase L1-like esterase
MMPPAPYIEAIFGNTLTLSQTLPSSLAEIRDFDPVPWEHYPAYWNLDGQHFTYAGYQRISKMTAKELLNGLLGGKDVP